MYQFDFLFVLNKLFNNTDGKREIVALNNLPLITSFLSNAGDFRNVEIILGADYKRWTPAEICRISADITNSSDGNNQNTRGFIAKQLTNHSGDDFSLKKIKFIDEIYPIAQDIIASRKNCSWQKFFEKAEIQNYRFDDPNKVLETVFINVFELIEEQIEFINELINYEVGDSGPKLLAHLIMLNESIGDLLGSSTNSIFQKTSNTAFLTFIRELQLLGMDAVELSCKFIEIHPFKDEKLQLEQNQSFLEKLNKLHYIKSYSVFFQIIGNKDKSDQLIRSGKKILTSIENDLILFPVSDISINKNLESQILQSKTSNNGQKEEFKEKTFSESIEHIAQLSITDLESAKIIADDIFNKIILKENYSYDLYRKDFGEAKKPEEITQVFINIDSLSQANILLSKFLKLWPQNIFLLRQAANLNYDNGDQLSSAKYFLQLVICDDLTRDEKKKYAKSLEYLKQWHDALEIRKRINIINDEDFLDIANCAYYSKDLDYLKSLVSENSSRIQNNSLIALFPAFIEKEKYQINEIKEKIFSEGFITGNSVWGILIAANYLAEMGDYESAIQISENTKGNNHVEILNFLSDIYLINGDAENRQKVLNGILEEDINNQSAFEDLVSKIIQMGKIDKAEQLLFKYSKKWVLSPRKLNLQAKIYIEKGDFNKAENILKSFIARQNYEADCLFDYCLAILNCNISDFPFGIHELDQKTADKLLTLINATKDTNSFYFELLKAELDGKSPLNNYQQLMKKYFRDTTIEIWRVNASLGKEYIKQRQYDLAIINLNQALAANPGNHGILGMLLQCYVNLKLWNEIENLFNQNIGINKTALLKEIPKSDNLFQNLDWIQFLKNQIAKNPEEFIFSVLLSQALIKNGKNLEAIEIIKSYYEKLDFEDDLFFYCMQILIDADELKLSERLIEIYLSNKKKLTKTDYISTAFLYDQLGKTEKSLAMINHLNELNVELSIYRTKLVFESMKENLTQDSINQLLESQESEGDFLKDIIVRIPEIITAQKKDSALRYLIAASFDIQKRNFDRAISTLKQGKIKYPDNEDIIFNLGELQTIIGEEKESPEYNLEANRSEINYNSPLHSCFFGELSLIQNEEVSSACYLSDALKIDPDNPRVKALQSRLMLLNGNTSDAKAIFNNALIMLNSGEYQNKSTIHPYSHILPNSRFWLAQAALELKEYRTAYNTCLKEIDFFGITIPCLRILLSAFAGMLEDEFIFGEILAKCQIQKISEEELTNFKILEQDSKFLKLINKEIKELQIKCNLFLNNSQYLLKYKDLTKAKDNINAILFGIYKHLGQADTEIMFNSLQTDFDNEFFIALLEKEDQPKIALEHLRKIINNQSPNAKNYALLAMIENKLGNTADAYSAICLALNEWPDEYEWQILAGDLGKRNGNLHTALSHYENAQKIMVKYGIDGSEIIQQLPVENISSIPLLEKQILQNPNKDKLIQLGKLFLKFGNYHKAIKMFESSIKKYPDDALSYFWLSETASRLNNPKKALIEINKALELDNANADYICLKALLLNITVGYEQAIRYLDETTSLLKINNIKIVLSKMKIILENEGDVPSLKYLDSLSDYQENSAILIEKAKLKINLRKIDEAELIAEKLLKKSEGQSDVLALFGLISKTKGELDRAIDFYIKAISINPFSEDLYIQLAEIYNDKKDFKECLDTIEDGIKTNPGSFSLLYRAGLYYYQHDLISEAEKLIKEAIKIKPDHSDAKNILELLENNKAIRNDSLIPAIIE